MKWHAVLSMGLTDHISKGKQQYWAKLNITSTFSKELWKLVRSPMERLW